ncbi:MAG: hypothetical protein JXA03_10680 [Bacteroidales bacterium]|nr:hypothetical protein [Bacteroidales bacterium]
MRYHQKYLDEAAGLHELKPFDGTLQLGWQSPSNIALVKYWGKRDVQIPLNPSLSFTLQNSYSLTFMKLSYAGIGKMQVEFTFEGQANAGFSERVVSFLKNLAIYFPFLDELHIGIDSRNSFPHSSGIASSASAMSSLALCLVSAERELFGTPLTDEDFLTKASFMARLGSGSAARSVFPGYVIWGEHDAFPGSDNETGVSCGRNYSAEFGQMFDSVLIVSPEKKKVSSSAGHKMMEGHPYKEARIEQANWNILLLHRALQTGDVNAFIRITEQEALSLHGLMMSSDPGFSLLNDNTMKIIEEIRNFREKTGIPACFTLDAGPNVHLIYPAKYRQQLEKLISQTLKPYCHQGKWIDDRMGEGPLRIK